MHRFFVAPEALAGTTVALVDEVAHQIARVLRLRPDERIVLLDGTGNECIVRLTAVTPSRVEGEVELRRPGSGEPRLRLTLYQAPLKGDHMDYVLQKGTEVGIAAFVPVLTERTVARAVDERRLARWRRIVREAAEQARRAVLPVVHPLMPLEAACKDLAALPTLILWEEEQARGLAEAVRTLPRPLATLALLVGPEGGLSPAEVARARAAGATPITLGPRMLRAETAGLVAAAALLYEAGDLGGPPA
jgi:16S rRNA (uracil1498-N3)-methyltransferase